MAVGSWAQPINLSKLDFQLPQGELSAMSPIATTSGIDQIGETAGLVWHLLNASGPLSLTKLAKQIDAPRDIVMQAVGWLAREGKVWVENGSRGRSVSLR
jgi:hypothetical protein